MGKKVDITAGFNAEKQFARMTFDGRKLDGVIASLFLGQWGDFWDNPEDMAKAVKDMGYESVGTVTWGGPGIDIVKALGKKGDEYLSDYVKTLAKYDIGISTVGDHCATQAVASTVFTPGLIKILGDDIKQGATNNEILYMPNVQEDIRFNAAVHAMNTARVTERLREVAKKAVGPQLAAEKYSPTTIVGFTGSPIWHTLAHFPPVAPEEIDAAFEQVAYRMARILDVYKNTGNRFGLEVHPGEIANDLATAMKIMYTIDRDEFGINGDSSHSVGRGWDYVAFIKTVAKAGKLFASHIKSAAAYIDSDAAAIEAGVGQGDGTAGIYNAMSVFGAPERGWDFRSLGRGTQDEGKIIYALHDAGLRGGYENEWEDTRVDKIKGATASAFILNGYIKGNRDLIMQGLKMYEDKKTYLREVVQFDKAMGK